MLHSATLRQKAIPHLKQFQGEYEFKKKWNQSQGRLVGYIHIIYIHKRNKNAMSHISEFCTHLKENRSQ